MSQEFRCRFCGDMFTLSEDDQELWEEGYLIDTPDACDYCAYNAENAQAIEADYPNYSDADPGL